MFVVRKKYYQYYRIFILMTRYVRDVFYDENTAAQLMEPRMNTNWSESETASEELVNI